MPDSFDFEVLSALAAKDPSRFEKVRAEMIEVAIGLATNQHKMRQLQWRLDGVRRRCQSPLKACMSISAMMWETFGDLREQLNKYFGPSRPAPRLVDSV